MDYEEDPEVPCHGCMEYAKLVRGLRQAVLRAEAQRDMRPTVEQLVAVEQRVVELEAARDEVRGIAEAMYDEGDIDVDHDSDCPADDTCECHDVARANLLYALLHDDADTAKRMRAILHDRDDQ